MCGDKILRKAQNNKDNHQIIKLIDKIYKIYGDYVNTEKYDKDLTDLDKYYFEKGGFFWVCEHKNKIIGTIALRPKNEAIELKRMYLDPKYHGSGIAQIMLNTAIEWAKKKNFNKIFLWSDVRFKRGHNFYLKNGFKKGKKRLMFDANYPYEEFYFEKEI